MQGREGLYASQHLPIAHESFEHWLSGEYGSLSFNELSDQWGDSRLYSQEITTHAVLHSEKLGCNEGSTSATTSEDPINSFSIEFHRPDHRSCSYPDPSNLQISARGTLLEYPQPLQHEDKNSPRPVASSVASVGLNSTLIYNHRSSRSSEEENTALPLKSSHQPEILEKTLYPHCQPLTGLSGSFQSQSLARGRAQDAAVVEHFSDAVNDSEVTVGSQLHKFLQGPTMTMSSSRDLNRRRESGECGTGAKAHQSTRENLNSLKLKQKATEESFASPPPRKYQRRSAADSDDIWNKVNGLRTPLAHIQRERQRRDIMTSKIAELELLLPKRSKRDRVAVVYDAIELLNGLEEEIKVLQKKFRETKLRWASTAPSARHRQALCRGKISIPKPVDCNFRTSGGCFSNEVVIKRIGNYMKPIITPTQPTLGTSGKSRPTQKFSTISSGQCLGNSKMLDTGNVFVEFQIQLDDTVTVQEEKLLNCRCRKDYLSTMMGLVVEFQLEVISCNIVKLSGFFVCVVALKSQERIETTIAAKFAVRLRSAVDIDIAREAVTPSLSGATN